MAKSCKLAPTISKREGVHIKEYESKLFESIKEAVGDYNTAWELWAYTKTPEFKQEYKDSIEYDELGEITFPSLIKALDLEEVYNDEKGAEQAARDYKFTGTLYDSPKGVINLAEDFNRKEKKFVAIVEKEGGKYKIAVHKRNAANLNHAKQQSQNHMLTREILNLMYRMGFNVEMVNDSKFDGLFDPENAQLADGLLTVIKIVKGERGERALPEEFSHMIIEGLRGNALVHRLLESLDNTQVRTILGEDYEKYRKEYDGNVLRMKKEAAGKLLAQYITKKGTINADIVRAKRSLLSRIWDWVKKMLSKITDTQISQAHIDAYSAVAQIYDLISSDEIVTLIDRGSILNAQKLYRLSSNTEDLEQLARAGEKIVALGRNMAGKKADWNRYKEATKALESIRATGDNHFKGIKKFLDDTKSQILGLNKSMKRAKELEKSGDTSSIKVIAEIAKVARDIDTFVQGYTDLLGTLAALNTDEGRQEFSGLTDGEATLLAKDALEYLQLLNNISEWRSRCSRNILMYISRTVYKHDIKRNIGNRRDELMSLEQIVDHAERDISVIDRWFSALSDADDAMLTIFDSIVKNQQYERDMELIGIRAKIAAEDDKLKKAGYTSDFIFERTADGTPRGRLISIYDWDGYEEDLKKRVAELRDEQERLKKDDIWYKNRLKAWKDAKVNGEPRLIRVYVDPEIDAYYQEHGKNATEKKYKNAVVERMPNPKIYSKNIHVIDNLPEAQRNYYKEMIRLKREMMTKIPHRGQGIFKTINISKDFIEGLADSEMRNPIKVVGEYFSKKFTRRPDDIGFGTGETYKKDIEDILNSTEDSETAADNIINYMKDALSSDVVGLIKKRVLKSIINKNPDKSEAAKAVLDYIASQDFVIVDVDFASHRVQSIPVYYTKPLKRNKDGGMPTLLTDFSGAMVAYSAMAVNYEKMNEVVDILEVGRNYIKNERKVRVNEGSSPIIARFSALNKIYKTYVEKAGSETNIGGRLDDYMDAVVYEERKLDEGTLVGNIDTAKTLDAIKDYTGLLGLGFNLLSSVSNLAVGKLQMWIEANAGEYFTFKDYAKAVQQYSSMIMECLSEIASPVKKSKLSLLIQMFDPMGDYYESLRDPNMHKSAAARILGEGLMAYIGMNAGEHVLHCQTMLAILNNVKLINTKTEEKISLFDALEVKEINGIHQLVLQDNLVFERDLIDYTGTVQTDEKGRIHSRNKNYGKPLRDKDGKIKTERIPLDPKIGDNETRRFIMRQKRRIRKVNDSLNGAFSANDKGAVHRIALLRLVMQYRQWMPAHYMRRFAREHYDADLEQWREGYYVTVFKTTQQMLKEIKKGRLEFLKVSENMSEHEKANLRRANAEIAEFLILMTLVRFGGRVKDRDRSWLERMMLYQVNRMYLEVGASMPGPEFFSNILQILQKPAASIDTFEKFRRVLNMHNMFDEIQTGRYAGWTELERDTFKLVPGADQIMKAIYFDDSLFSMYEKDR